MPEPSADQAICKDDSLVAGWWYFAPLALGLLVFIFCLWAAYGDWRFNYFNTKLFSNQQLPRYYLISYLLMLSSVIVVTVGTSIYFIDEVFGVRYKYLKGHGYIEEMSALILCIFILLPMYVFLAYILQFPHNICEGDDVKDRFFHILSIHDRWTFIVFLCFYILDRILLKAAKSAKMTPQNGISATEHYSIVSRAKRLESLSRAQLYLIDIAVVIGALAILVFDCLISNSKIFGAAEMAPFLKGIATGYLAAHIIVSQIVFFFLNYKADEILKTE